MSYYVLEDLYTSWARVHLGECSSCNYGQGTSEGASTTTQWHGPYEERSQAFEKMESLEKDDARGCQLCNP